MASSFRIHASDCAMHNAPAMPPESCDCGAGGDEHDAWANDQWDKIWSRGGLSSARAECRRQTRALIADLHRQLHKSI